jgi:glycogen operon protein
MLMAGDELGRTQLGNNNAYCHDGSLSWLDWSLADDNADLVSFTESLVALRRRHPAFRRPKFFQGRPLHGTDAKDIGWFTPEGTEMSHDSWDKAAAKAMGVYLNGEALDTIDAQGMAVRDDTFLLLLNGEETPTDFVLPGDEWATAWVHLVDTATGDCGEDGHAHPAGTTVTVEGRALILLRREA